MFSTEGNPALGSFLCNVNKLVKFQVNGAHVHFNTPPPPTRPSPFYPICFSCTGSFKQIS
jgi:hypothetical protein